MFECHASAKGLNSISVLIKIKLLEVPGIKFHHDNGVVQMTGGSQAVLSLAVLRETRCEHLRVRVACRSIYENVRYRSSESESSS